jgi:hypothetical protein
MVLADAEASAIYPRWRFRHDLPFTARLPSHAHAALGTWLRQSGARTLVQRRPFAVEWCRDCSHNERLVCHFDLGFDPFAVVLVG